MNLNLNMNVHQTNKTYIFILLNECEVFSANVVTQLK